MIRAERDVNYFSSKILYSDEARKEKESRWEITRTCTRDLALAAEKNDHILDRIIPLGAPGRLSHLCQNLSPPPPPM